MRNMLTRFACVCTVTLLLNFGQSRAGVVVSNLTATVGGTGTIYTPSATGTPQAYAQEFTTGSQSVELATVIASLGAASGTFTPSAELVADSSGLPSSTVLTSFTVPSIPTGTSYSDLTFTPNNTSVLLSANTDYWFVLAATGTGASYKWQYTDTTNTSLPNYAYSHDSGATWTTGAGGPFLIEVDSVTQVSSVPEPSSVVLIALGVPAVAIAMRRRFASIVRTNSQHGDWKRGRS